MEPTLEHLTRMRAEFDTLPPSSYEDRRAGLERLKKALLQHEKEIYAALYTDLKKNPEECWVTEIGFVLAEINFALKHLHAWMRPKKVRTNLLNFPGRSYILSEPLGVTLIIGPWNYPLQLVLAPLVGALAAGNGAVLKPSELAPATTLVVKKIIAAAFDPVHVTVVEGDGATVIPQMMNGFRFDYVFYTGSTAVGTLIYEMAARKLVPVTLELGGKSPCIIEPDASLKIAARRIAVTKFSNAGQMCVAPDYVLVHKEVKEAFVHELKEAIHSFYNSEAVRDYHYGKVVNQKQFRRLVSYMEQGRVIYGGSHDEDRLFVEPTIIDNVDLDAPVMEEEIFGPVLPLISWENEEEVYRLIRRNNNPLALYVFTGSDAKAEKWTRSLPFGGGCVNNASWHLTNHHLPFGGRGNSGIGQYHGPFSFETFSHKKAVMRTPSWFDPALKYPPFKGKLNLLKRFIK